MEFDTIYGKIKVIGEDHIKTHVWRGRKKIRRFFKFICHCGKEFVGDYQNFKSGKRVSCGCAIGRRAEFFKNSNTRHGESKSKLYKVFKGICARCNNKNEKNYGGRGIKCLWESYADFKNDMGESYREGLEIDRIDVNGNYEKGNCRWVTCKENADNKRRSVLITVDGITKSMVRWCEQFGVSYTMVRRRIQQGWDRTEALLTKPLRNPR